MSTEVYNMNTQMNPSSDDLIKPELSQMTTSSTTTSISSGKHSQMRTSPSDATGSLMDAKNQQHPLHQFDLTMMQKFFESCVAKMVESNPKWNPNEWNRQSSGNDRDMLNEPMVLSSKQVVYEAFAKMARDSGEQMVLLPNFEYGDIINFDRFLQNLQLDGINSMIKYKQFLSNKDTRKYELDLVVMHAKYGIILVEVRDCDHMDSKRRGRARLQLNSARSCLQSLARRVFEAKGWLQGEAHLPVTEFIAIPNAAEKPQSSYHPVSVVLQPANGNQNQSASSTSSSSGMKRTVRLTDYLTKPDLASPAEFAKWWKRCVVEPREQLDADPAKKVNKCDQSVMNWMLGLINCIRNNMFMPVVYQEAEGALSAAMSAMGLDEKRPESEPREEKDSNKDSNSSTAEADKDKHFKETQFQPALKVHAEFFHPDHEKVRSLSKVIIASKNEDKIRKTICKQVLWLLINDQQKKISVISSEMNKPYYEEFFARQRKLYSNCNNVRFYTEVESCTVNSQTTLNKKDTEAWFFDCGLKKPLESVMERVRNVNAFWVFTNQEEMLGQWKEELEARQVRIVRLDERKPRNETEEQTMPWLSDMSIKIPMRLQTDLLVIGDLISTNQLRIFFRQMKSSEVPNQSYLYNNVQYQNQNNQNIRLCYNPSKKLKNIKFIRGGTIDNIRTALKMHDSIHAPVVVIHVGDEDLFKTRNALKTTERIKEMASLVREYCPKSAIVLSTLMKRASRTENTVCNEVNKGLMEHCRQTKDTLNLSYMLNPLIEPDYHTQDGRILNNRGVRVYSDNILYFIDQFVYRNIKQL